MRPTSSVSTCSAVFLVVVSAAVLVPDTAHADRRTSLNGNQLILDQDDVFLYPQMLDDYSDRIRLDYGTSDQSGSGLLSLTLGDAVWGVGINRGTLLDPQISPEGETSALGFPTIPILEIDAAGTAIPGYVDTSSTFTAVDGFLAFGDWGFRLGLGGGGTSSDPDSGGVTGTTHTFVTAAVGYQIANSDAVRMDAAGNLFVDIAEDVAGGDTQTAGRFIGLRLDGRGYWKVAENTEIGAIADLSVLQQTATFEQAAGDPSAVGVQYGASVGAGPVFHFPRRTTFATYVVSGVLQTGADPNSEGVDDQVSQTRILFPGVRASFETALLEWLYLRTGMRYNFVLESIGIDGLGTTSSRLGEFDWDAGLGFDLGAVDIDATFNPGVLTSGTWLLSGNAQAPLTMISATVAWDELRDFSDETPEPTVPDDAKPEKPRADQSEAGEEGTTEGAEQPAEDVEKLEAPAKKSNTAPTSTDYETKETSAPESTGSEPPAQENTPATETTQPDAQATEMAPAASAFQPQTFSFPEEGRQRIDDGTTRGTISSGWEIWYDGEPWGSGHRVRSKGGEQVIAVEEGAYGITREVGDVGGRVLKIQHRFTGNGFYEVLANDKPIARYIEPMYEIEELELPEGTTRITIKVGSIEPDERAAAIINQIEIN